MASSSLILDNTNPDNTTKIPTPTVADLKDSSAFPNLWYRIHVLITALKSFDKPASNKRLEKIIDPCFIGEPYFAPKEADTIKKTIINGKEFSCFVEEELSKRFDRRNKERVESGNFRICAAHDLAPIMPQALGIDLKQLEKDKRFSNLVGEKGLHLRAESWGGLRKKSFSPKKKKH
ncbi:hypothetical protein BDV38DRAFT_281233 [Aspergillus pseudotamarii]|uniref:Uncharacterized protein n=1 Tax=Aspergillus pseudotamarii TaxID=132259 RepID=A0A5N6T065_ASPPS|nr:uncharacterized protein BDV38DRAFT_281233 [Aspergillus pseudotamarii]KAE8139469.1 hypothetical protein BDV38DRAFT_281233 [Aspergillus pseudotamarii]